MTQDWGRPGKTGSLTRKRMLIKHQVGVRKKIGPALKVLYMTGYSRRPDGRPGAERGSLTHESNRPSPSYRRLRHYLAFDDANYAGL